MSQLTNHSSYSYYAFVGIPNSGKSTLFNELTGLKQKVGNFPGITVEPAIGTIMYSDSTINVVDLPGTYSFSPKSQEEEFTLRSLQTHTNQSAPNIEKIVFVIDATNLEKGLCLYSECVQRKIPMLVIVTMIDSLKQQGSILDDIELERVLGVNVLTVVGNKGLGIQEVKRSLFDEAMFTLPESNIQSFETIEQRVDWARSVTSKVIPQQRQDKFSLRLDSVLLHPIWGLVIFGVVLLLFFQSIFSWAQPIMDVVESVFAYSESIASTYIPPGIVQNFVTKGLIAGVGSVIVFLPQILLLTFFVTLLEDCGYLARAAFLVDRIMGAFGLQGRSFIPLLGSFACAIPGIMSARIIPSEKDRLATILVAPLMTCSARLPVYTLLISVVIPPTTLLHFFTLQAAVLAGLYVLGLGSGLCVAFLLKKTILQSDKLHFLMEFPPYRMPSLKSLRITIISRIKDFLTTAGSTILFISMVLWVLTEFPTTPAQPNQSPEIQAQMQLENSAAGTIGKSLAPVFAPLGFDWKITLGVFGSFAAREVFVSVMGQIYATSTVDSTETLRSTLQRQLTLPTSLSIIVFYVFALQCISTIAIIRRETGSWKWSVFAFGYTFIIAYSMSFLTYVMSKMFLL